MRNMLRFLKGYEKESILAPLFKMLEACFELLVPLVVANIIDVGIKNGDLAYIGKQCGLMVLLAVVGMASSLTAQYFAAKAALGYGTALRGALFRHIDTLSYTELDGIGTPTLVTRMTSDVNQLQNGVNMTLRLLLRCPFIVIGALILAFVISPTMGFWFVLVTLAISLVVSSIMIGVITYISVLERRKEIGILRAIGASKRNISEVFNAETFIIGLCSGVMGVVLCLLLLIPGNMLIHHIAGDVNVVASLPPQAALILIVLATLLTMLGGLIPARSAAKSNPVKALRSE